MWAYREPLEYVREPLREEQAERRSNRHTVAHILGQSTRRFERERRIPPQLEPRGGGGDGGHVSHAPVFGCGGHPPELLLRQDQGLRTLHDAEEVVDHGDADIWAEMLGTNSATSAAKASGGWI